MERSGIKETGRAIAYIKEGLEEIANQHETHITVERIDLNSGQRFYFLPNHASKIIDIRCKNHGNGDDEYRSIPRSIHEPSTKDSDGI